MSHVNLLNKMGAKINLKRNVAYIDGVNELYGKNLVGSDLRSSAALVIAAISAKGISYVSGLDHLDRGYENFESKLTNLGVNIKRENSKKAFVKTKYEKKGNNIGKEGKDLKVA